MTTDVYMKVKNLQYLQKSKKTDLIYEKTLLELWKSIGQMTFIEQSG